MEQLQHDLDQLILQSFHLVPINTQRQDQWYKRQYQGKWKGRLPLILTPRESRNEWTPRVHQFAAKFAKSIHIAVKYGSSAVRDAALQAETESSDGKIFQDKVLDEFQTTFTPCSVEEGALTPAMQRLEFWNSHFVPGKPDPQARADVVRALLACEQIGPLLYLARRSDVPLKEMAPRKTNFWSRGQFHNRLTGWEFSLEEAVEVLFFVQILNCFPDVLNQLEECERWVPYAFASEMSPMRRYLQARSGSESSSKLVTDAQEQARRCVRIVCLEQMLADSCGLPALDMEKFVITSFLSFLGFEAWNREREGVGYLGCDLNKAKGEEWLWHYMGNEDKQAAMEQREHDADDVLRDRPKPQRPRDPLLLREPKPEPIEDPSDEDAAELNKLAVMEAEETAYGRKRSTKYHRKT